MWSGGGSRNRSSRCGCWHGVQERPARVFFDKWLMHLQRVQPSTLFSVDATSRIALAPAIFRSTTPIPALPPPPSSNFSTTGGAAAWMNFVVINTKHCFKSSKNWEEGLERINKIGKRGLKGSTKPYLSAAWSIVCVLKIVNEMFFRTLSRTTSSVNCGVLILSKQIFVY